jgi:hypothetical protein
MIGALLGGGLASFWFISLSLGNRLSQGLSAYPGTYLVEGLNHRRLSVGAAHCQLMAANAPIPSEMVFQSVSNNAGRMFLKSGPRHRNRCSSSARVCAALCLARRDFLRLSCRKIYRFTNIMKTSSNQKKVSREPSISHCARDGVSGECQRCRN